MTRLTLSRGVRVVRAERELCRTGILRISIRSVTRRPVLSVPLMTIMVVVALIMSRIQQPEIETTDDPNALLHI